MLQRVRARMARPTRVSTSLRKQCGLHLYRSWLERPRFHFNPLWRVARMHQRRPAHQTFLSRLEGVDPRRSRIHRSPMRRKLLVSASSWRSMSSAAAGYSATARAGGWDPKRLSGETRRHVVPGGLVRLLMTAPVKAASAQEPAHGKLRPRAGQGSNASCP